MTANETDRVMNLRIYETHGSVLLLPNQQHDRYHGPVRSERVGTGFRYWFLYQNTPRRCVNFGGTCGWQEIETPSGPA